MNGYPKIRFIYKRFEKRKRNDSKRTWGGSCVSDKAVSKWERGLSFPDITLLPILANALNVTVGEIINGERNVTQTVALESVEKMLDKTMEYSKQSYSLKMKTVIATIMLLFALLPNAICIIIDFSSNSSLSWSLYPVGGLLMLFFTVLTALFTKHNKLEATASTLFITLSLYLILISFLSGTKGWVLSLGLPVSLVSIVTLYIIIKSFSKMRNKYYAWAVTLLAMVAGPYILVNMIVSLNGITRTADYSAIIGIPILLIASVILFIVGRQKKI